MTELDADAADIADQDTPDRRDHRRNTPANGKDAFDRNSHTLRRGLMIGHGPHKNAGAGILEKNRKKCEQHQRYAHAPHVQVGNLNPPDINGLFGEYIELADIIAP